MIGGQALFFLVHGHGATLRAHQHLVLGVLEVAVRDHATVLARRRQSRLVDQIGQVGAGEARRAARDGLDVHVGGQGHILHVDAQDAFTARDVGVRHHHLTVETAGTQQGRVQHVGTVGRGDQDDVLGRLEAVHLDQQLVQRLFALVIAAAQTGAAMTAHGVDFVDEDDAGGVLLGLFEHVAHAAGADADEHFDEVRPRDREEGHARLPRDRAGQQRLAGAGRAHQQGALGDLAAQTLELARILQEVDDLLQFVLGLVHAGDVLEGLAALVFGQQLGLGLAKAHGPARPALHLAHEEDPHPDQQGDGQDAKEQAHPDRLAARLGVDLDPRLQHGGHQLFVGIDGGGGEALAVLQLAVHLVDPHRHLLDVAGVHPLHQFGIAHDFGPSARRLTGHAVHRAALGQGRIARQQRQNDHAGDRQITQVH